MSAGSLNQRVLFQAPVATSDGQGGTEDGWSAGFVRWAGYRRLRGGEAVIAARLAGVQPTVITIRADTETRAIDPTWRATDQRTGEIFALRAVIVSDDRAFIEITAESGVAP